MRAGLVAFIVTATVFGQSKVDQAVVEKARSLERRGLTDLAAQTWQQVLLSQPGNTEALAGLARAAKKQGNEAEAGRLLERLRQINPRDPQIAAIEGTVSNKVQNARRAQAEALASARNYTGAMQIYREIYGDHPPEDVALEYYDTEAATEEGRNHAIAGLRQLAQLYPHEARYQATLGRVLSYNPKTRAEGISLLRQWPQDASAQKALQQALAWDAQKSVAGNAAPSAAAAESTRFWHTMGDANQALEQDQLDLATQRYREALALKSTAPEALAGLAGTLLRNHQSSEAARVYARWVKAQPNSAPAWRGLFMATAQGGHAQEALEVTRRFPSAVAATLDADPNYLVNLAPVLAAAGQQEQAAGLYRKAVAAQPENAAAWQGLVLAQHLMHDDAGVVETVESMPRAAYDTSRRDPGFLSMVAAAYQQQGQGDEAQRLLEEAGELLSRRGSRPSVDMELQMAAIERQRNHAQAAATLYRRVLETDAARVDAWSGLLATLHQAGEDAQALAEVGRLPAQVQSELAGKDDYLLTLSAIYSATGHSRWALAALSRLRERYAAQGVAPPAEVEIQRSWLLLRAGEEGDLYSTLMGLGGRGDLTDGQRAQVQNIWATWSVRRAAQATASGNTRGSVVILNAAREALGGNDEVSRALAGGYLTAGDAPSALAIYQSLELASTEDYQGAVGAALAAKNLKLAEGWLRVGLERYPQDARILALAARFEQARGDNGRAREYWKASLAQSPATGAGDWLAQTLRTPAAGARPRGGSGDTLAALLGSSSGEARRTHLLPGESAMVADERPVPVPGLETAPQPILTPEGRGEKRLDDKPVARPISPISSTAPVNADPPGRLTLRYASARQGPTPELERASSQQEVPQSPGLTDEQLADAHLPALSRNYVPVKPSAALSPRQEARQQIAAIDGGLSPWVGGTGDVRHRSGTAGYDQLTALEAPFEASTALGTEARLTVITTPVFLDAGAADGSDPFNFGSLPANKIPPQQYADGVASELQLTSANFAARVGDTPYGFLVTNIVGGVRWRPQGGPLSFTFSRESVKDTQLSYSGVRDPGSATATFDGNIWGGVIANGGDVQVAHGDALSGFYAGVGGQYITGRHVQTNTRFHGNAGAYWRVLSLPDLGTLVLGANFFGMHYAHNLRYFSYGQGGYFSPEAYFLAAMPLSWTGHYGPDLHYTVTGSIGAQSFQEDSAPYFPLDPRLQAAFGAPKWPVHASVGSNYDLQTEMAYRVQDHWYVGGFLDFNNTRDYESQSGGFFVRYLFRPQGESEPGPIGAFPREGFRPVMVP